MNKFNNNISLYFIIYYLVKVSSSYEYIYMPDGNIYIDVGHYKHFTRLLCNVYIGNCAKKYCSFDFNVVDYGIICGVHNMASK